MSNASLQAKSAINSFSQARSAAVDPAGLKLAEGLLALAQAIEGPLSDYQELSSTSSSGPAAPPNTRSGRHTTPAKHQVVQA
jgi:hypothetical protein